jgi:predicted nucleic acid-binding Zn ribbon protein
MQSLRNVMGQLEQSPQWHAQARFRRLLSLWPQVVGAAVSQHSRPTGLQRDTLLVAVSSAAWAQTLTLERLSILKKLRDRLPKTEAPTDIRFSTGRWASAPQGTPLPNPALNGGEAPTPALRRQAPDPRPKTAAAAFEQWADRLRSHQAQQPSCPTCGCPSPPAELQRWSCCSLCATQAWKHTISSQRSPIAPPPASTPQAPTHPPPQSPT